MSRSPKTVNKSLIAFITLLIIPISGLCIDIYIPSLPAVSQYFHIDKSLAQLSITVYMVGLGCMQLFAGGITDSFGRRKPFLIGMLVFIIATLCIPLVHNIYQLLALRLLQGTVVALLVVPLRSVIPDLFEGAKLHKMLNYMVIAWSVGPIVAPFIGGYLQHYFDWQANFYFLAIYSIIGFLLMWFILPETIVHRHPFHLLTIFHRYKMILFNWQYSNGLMISAFLYSILILFSVVGTFLMQKVMHYSAIQFGQMSLLLGMCWTLGAITNRFLLHISLEAKAKFCLWVMLATAVFMALSSMHFAMTVYVVLLPILLLTWLGGVIFPNFFSRALSLFPTMTGSANALFGGFIFLIPGLISGFGTFLKSNSQLPLSIAYIVLVIMCLILCYSAFGSSKKD